MPQEKTSVVLTLLNEGAGLRALLDALLEQTSPPDEIVIVDGGSTDGTAELLHEYAANDERFRILVEPGVNIAKGRNIAIAAATSPLIAVTDGGCLPEPTWLANLVKPLCNDSDYMAVAGNIVAAPKSRFEYYAGLLGMASDSGDSRTRWFLGRSSAFRKSAWERAGGYPEWLYTAEDTLFAKRFNQLGMPVALAEDSKLLWRPRRNLYRLAKMFFLYGKGNGRIQLWSAPESLYWLRFHLIWIICTFAGLFSPWFLLIAAADVAYLLNIAARPALATVSKATRAWDRYWYVPMIVFVRSFTTHAGFLLGDYEYRTKPYFRQQLETYEARH